ncbi:MAG: hypothetical protein WBD10_05215, partial [Acidobacteriaceae bacterium]
VESLPKSGDIPFAPNADYLIKFGSGPHTFAYGRLFRSANIIYKPTEYAALRTFFQKVSTSDQEQVAVKVLPVVVPATATVPATTAAPTAAPGGK